MAFFSSNQTSSSTIMAIHETQDRTLLTVIVRFTTFFHFSELLCKKNVNSTGALANFSLCSAVHLPYAKEKENSQHIWNPSLHLGSHCTALKILGLKTGMSCKEMSSPLKPECVFGRPIPHYCIYDSHFIH